MKSTFKIMKFFLALFAIAVTFAAIGLGAYDGAAAMIMTAPLILANIENSDDAKQKRSKIWDKMNEMIQLRKSEKRDFTNSEKTKYEQLRSDFDVLTERLKELEADEKRALIMAGKAADESRRQNNPKGSAWIDLETGNQVEVLERSEKMTDVIGKDRNLNLGRALRALVTGNWTGAAEERAALATTSGSGLLVPTTVFSDVLDLARSKSVVFQAGGLTALMPDGRMNLARVASDPEIQEKAENEAFSNDNIIFDALPLKAETIGAVCVLSRELAMDAPNIGRAIEVALANAVARRLDYLALNGTGSNNQPEGLLHNAGVHEVDLENDPLHYGHLLRAWHLIAAANGTPRTIALNPLEMAALNASYHPNFGWLPAPELLKNLQWLESTAVQHHEPEGEPENHSDAFLGDFSQLVVGLRQNAFIELSTEAGNAFQKHQLAIKVTLRGTIGVLRPSHFARLVNISTPESWADVNFGGPEADS
jgi:HK97 family phage major capsid protein